jgi:hypothetical protein
MTEVVFSPVESDRQGYYVIPFKLMSDPTPWNTSGQHYRSRGSCPPNDKHSPSIQ